MGLLFVVSVLIFKISVAVGSNDLLREYETSEREFKRFEIGNKIVYFHQRMIDNAIVEKDFIVYQFDTATGILLKKKVQWRDDLPEHILFSLLSKEDAESIAEGEILFSTLYIISPESDVFPLDPTPTNPCWVVRSIQDGNPIVTIIDAVTGEWLDFGVPPPYTGFSLSGPQYWNPCEYTWTEWYQNARDWFQTMGYLTETAVWPTENKVKSHIQSNTTALFYELAHGGSTSFCSGCSGSTSCENTSATEVASWISTYTKMPFTFIGSCDGMCDTGSGTLSYEFRKGSTTDTATIGYCGMSGDYCSNCWSYSISWQTALFSYMNDSYTVKQAYNNAMADYPVCSPTEGACMRFAGDQDFKVVPVVSRVCESDFDGDGIADCIDNCPEHPNGPALGLCVQTGCFTFRYSIHPCSSDNDCGGPCMTCLMNQEDSYPEGGNGIGDACEWCYADLDGDGKVFPSDAMVLLGEWKRKDCSGETPCQADIDGDGKVFPSDAMILLSEWKRKDCPVLP